MLTMTAINGKKKSGFWYDEDIWDYNCENE